ncbi:TetR/AcrR family transcriptional regulator [Mesorhizobium sp. M2D.F.Ca.ET.185.01.1.1]|uniref:TetR/AcrR family transcriptional regulator n=1 Tax=unclassified Mesorhizobium TaxID=325217 RepID=UPI000FCC913A|nr:MULTISPECIES: TetR/AcrR family transcriptional regulator [unclassified Mesorhizobium]TGP53655.1 TetR/AcrR family transcriptional regulator [bacterium M00.F.Ca.ET.230.01.1.1]TGP83493.1 TetR/AcrR family transcriptional regulator [bacterium M00.F.Ca.ET.227.01.1.1]TGP99448.1 TetR/AcrR family transcriptional regulator [bacterium M00.F.Ca.ET.221.01.1.1]TGQ00178.1 TetR/AcrR family transcriptional regulator [bacterium M00.F.Ca.ET.222.01.1.1]TGU11564.1 TetR/AcrR family transcriptional regulator [bac
MDEKVTAKADQPGIASPRRSPSQQRSRERVERMLAAASALIAEQGSDAMRMGEVAERAGVSIGSLYQFFPDKRAIVWALAERYTAESQACISAALKDVRDVEGFKSAFSELVDIYYQLFLAEPVIRDVWSGTQADKALRALELADSRANAEFLVAVLKRLRPDADPVELETTAFLVWQMGEAAVRLAISVDREEGDRLVEAYKRMALRELVGA